MSKTKTATPKIDISKVMPRVIGNYTLPLTFANNFIGWCLFLWVQVAKDEPAIKPFGNMTHSESVDFWKNNNHLLYN